MTLPELLREWLTSHRALSFCLDDASSWPSCTTTISSTCMLCENQQLYQKEGLTLMVKGSEKCESEAVPS